MLPDNNLIRAYDLNTAEQIGTASVAGASFLNGMGNDGNGILIVSDFSSGRILKVDATDPADMSVSTLVGNTGTTTQWQSSSTSANGTCRHCELGRQRRYSRCRS